MTNDELFQIKINFYLSDGRTNGRTVVVGSDRRLMDGGDNTSTLLDVNMRIGGEKSSRKRDETKRVEELGVCDGVYVSEPQRPFVSFSSIKGPRQNLPKRGTTHKAQATHTHRVRVRVRVFFGPRERERVTTTA